MKNNYCDLSIKQILALPERFQGYLLSPFQFNLDRGYIRVPADTFKEMTDIIAEYAAQDFDAMRQRAEKAEIALAEVRSMFPVKLDKQAFVVNGGEPLRADGDDEFYSATKVNHALAEILQRIDAALAKQP